MDMKLNVPFIRSERVKRAWTQQQLADVANLSLRTVQRIEATGKGGAESVKAIATAFDVDTERLLKGNEPEIPPNHIGKVILGYWSRVSALVVSLVLLAVIPYILFHTREAIGDADYYRFEGRIRLDDSPPHEFGIDVKSNQVFILDIDARHKLLFEAPAGNEAEGSTRIRLLQNDGKMYNVLHSSARPGRSGMAHSVAYRVCENDVVFYAPAVKTIPGCNESFSETVRQFH